MPYPLDQWWFWVFVAPEAVLFVGWVVTMVFGVIGLSLAGLWRWALGRRNGGA